MRRIKRIRVLSFAKFQAFLGAIIGLICGILYSFGGLIVDVLVTMGWMNSSETQGLSNGTVIAFGALNGMPIIFLIAGYLLGIIEAILYNFSTKWFNGLTLDFEFKD